MHNHLVLQAHGLPSDDNPEAIGTSMLAWAMRCTNRCR